MNRQQGSYTNSGFTILEIMVVLAIVATTSFLAVQSFQTIIADIRAVTISDRLFQHLMITRLQAIRYSRDIVFCKMNSSLDNCDISGSNWDYGWIAGFCNKTPPTTSITGTTILASQMSIPASSISMSTGRFGTNWIRFYRDGRIAPYHTLLGANDVNADLTVDPQDYHAVITITPKKCSIGRQITINMMGGASMINVSCP